MLRMYAESELSKPYIHKCRSFVRNFRKCPPSLPFLVGTHTHTVASVVQTTARNGAGPSVGRRSLPLCPPPSPLPPSLLSYNYLLRKRTEGKRRRRRRRRRAPLIFLHLSCGRRLDRRGRRTVPRWWLVENTHILT